MVSSNPKANRHKLYHVHMQTPMLLILQLRFILRLLSLFHSYSHIFPSHIHSYPTRGGGRLTIPRVNHTSYYYLGVTLFNKLPPSWKTLDRKPFSEHLKKYLIELEPYSIEDFTSVDLT
uniref:Uncharacterized protein n=1 Tax=Cacopsylla melanoneura TaxID=428564 RepID=A0A8D9DZ96_9HEMI